MLLAKARQETEDAITSGNRKYNEMLAERMRMEDTLQEAVNEVGGAPRTVETVGCEVW